MACSPSFARCDCLATEHAMATSSLYLAFCRRDCTQPICTATIRMRRLRHIASMSINSGILMNHYLLLRWFAENVVESPVGDPAVFGEKLESLPETSAPKGVNIGVETCLSIFAAKMQCGQTRGGSFFHAFSNAGSLNIRNYWQSTKECPSCHRHVNRCIIRLVLCVALAAPSGTIP